MQATSTLAKLETKWKANKIQLNTKAMLMKATVGGTLLYAVTTGVTKGGGGGGGGGGLRKYLMLSK